MQRNSTHKAHTANPYTLCTIRSKCKRQLSRCPLIATLLFHTLCGAQRSSASLPADGAERTLDFSTIIRYNSGTRTPRSRYHIIGKSQKYKEITGITTFVIFHRTVALLWAHIHHLNAHTKPKTQSVRTGFLVWWGMVDSNHRRHSQQIYSLSPLATREIPHIHFLLECLLEPVDGLEPPTC